MTIELPDSRSPDPANTPLALKSNEGLGPLPDAAFTYERHPGGFHEPERVGAYTASQMRAYAAEQVAAERERLLSELRTMHAQQNGRHNYYLYAAELLAGKL